MTVKKMGYREKRQIRALQKTNMQIDRKTVRRGTCYVAASSAPQDDVLTKRSPIDELCSSIRGSQTFQLSTNGFLVTHLKCRTILGPGLAVIINTCRSNIRMSQPFLHLGNIRLMIQRIGGRSRS